MMRKLVGSAAGLPRVKRDDLQLHYEIRQERIRRGVEFLEHTLEDGAVEGPQF